MMIEVEPVEEEEDVDIYAKVSDFFHRRTLSEVLVVLFWIGSIFIARYFHVVDLFLIVSSFVGIFRYGLSTREGNDGASRISAYSIFNPGFREIQGTLNVGQIEQNLLGTTGINNDGAGATGAAATGATAAASAANQAQDDFGFEEEGEMDEELQEAIRRSLMDTRGGGGGPMKSNKKIKEEKRKEKAEKKRRGLLNTIAGIDVNSKSR